jgi:3-oxoacyl-[acyl-carrier protein] reductase
MGILDGKVAIVTGAGQGLGRVEALELAKHGASVVVNDLGTDAAGGGSSEDSAKAVVAEIEAAGGKATAAFGDVADWDSAKRIVATAVETFGDLNIMVNNAGFSRDGMIVKMEEDQWDSVIRVHLKGHFCMIRHTMAHWREKSKSSGDPIYGRLISTASDAFMMGNVGQPNYAAAKGGIAYLTLSAAREVQRFGATANIVLPRARTRMTLDSPFASMFEAPEEGFDTFAPEHCAPVVAWLAGPNASNVSGNLLQVWGRQVRVYAPPVPSLDHINEKDWTVEEFDKVLGGFFEGKQPIEDSFCLPMA